MKGKCQQWYTVYHQTAPYLWKVSVHNVHSVPSNSTLPMKGVGGLGKSLWDSVGVDGMMSKILFRRVKTYWSSPSKVCEMENIYSCQLLNWPVMCEKLWKTFFYTSVPMQQKFTDFRHNNVLIFECIFIFYSVLFVALKPQLNSWDSPTTA